MKKLFFLYPIFIILGILMWIIGFKAQAVKNKKRQEELNKVDIQFTGTIIKKKEIRRSGRTSVAACIDLNYTNMQLYSFLKEKQYIYCRVENNIASIVIPSTYFRTDSVAINMNNNRLEQYYCKGELIAEFPLSLSYAYLKVEDLNKCFDPY